MNKPFEHRQHAHCESGVTANLLTHSGVPISEPMAFGIGAGIFFAYFPFIKVGGIPATTFRIWPGYIFKRVTQRLGIRIRRMSFRDPEEGMAALDRVLQQGIPVGLLAGVYYLDYLPEAFRFHFNAHNLVATGKRNGRYDISDPILEHATVIGPQALQSSRFAKGFPEPKGKMYYVTGVPGQIDFSKGIRAGIKRTCFFMLAAHLPWIGTRGIHTLAQKIEQYPQKLGKRKSDLYLGNIIRMQEEIGTGGGGFRFLYAAFLQEAGHYLQRDELLDFSKRYTAVGDDWRSFAYQAARIFKSRNSDVISFKELSKLLHDIGDKETAFFKDLKAMKW